MVSLETLIGSSAGLIAGGVVGWFSRVFFYKYKKRDQQKIQESNKRDQWYNTTIQLANDIQDAKDEWEERNPPDLKKDQRQFKFIADRLSRHNVNGEQIDIGEDILNTVEKTETKCREVTRPNTDFGAVGISSKIKAANQSAQQMEEVAKNNMNK